MIEIVTTVRNGLPVIARGTLTSDDIFYDLSWLGGLPFKLPISTEDDQRICEAIMERVTRARDLWEAR